jgi:hypothetical protein
VIWIFDLRRIKFFQDSLFFIVSQVTDWFVLYVPFAPFIFGSVISAALCNPADLVGLPGPKTDCDVLDSALAFIFNPAG